MDPSWLKLFEQLPVAAAILLVAYHASKFVKDFAADHRKQYETLIEDQCKEYKEFTESVLNSVKEMSVNNNNALHETKQVVLANTEMVGGCKALFIVVEQDLKRYGQRYRDSEAARASTAEGGGTARPSQTG